MYSGSPTTNCVVESGNMRRFGACNPHGCHVRFTFGEFFIIDGGSKMCLDTPKKNESRKEEWSCESERLKSTTTTVVVPPIDTSWSFPGDADYLNY